MKIVPRGYVRYRICLDCKKEIRPCPVGRFRCVKCAAVRVKEKQRGYKTKEKAAIAGLYQRIRELETELQIAKQGVPQ